jgi:hypothetical protein
MHARVGVPRGVVGLNRIQSLRNYTTQRRANMTRRKEKRIGKGKKKLQFWLRSTRSVHD